MRYQETLDYLFSQLPMYQRQGKSAFKKDLTNILAICDLLGNPQHQFKSVHIAGTNGKGSTAHMLASVFQEAGYKTGLYTSPHLKDFRERIRINGQPINEDKVIEFVENYQIDFDKIKPSFFEWTVALAFQHFVEEKVDITIVETGLGGRLDSTNIISPELSVITNIGYDHMDMLGNTLDAIAFEKAGIIKENTPVVVVNASGQEAVFNEKASSVGAPIHYSQDLIVDQSLQTDLLGSYQAENAKGCYHACLLLQRNGWELSEEHIMNGLKSVIINTGIRGRWEQLGKDPSIIAETAHNQEGLRIAMKQLSEEKYQRLHLVIGFVNDKEITTLLSLLPKEADYYFCQAQVIRAMPVEKLQDIATETGLQGNSYPTVEEAYQAAKKRASKEDIIYVGGSNFVVAEVL